MYNKEYIFVYKEYKIDLPMPSDYRNVLSTNQATFSRMKWPDIWYIALKRLEGFTRLLVQTML